MVTFRPSRVLFAGAIIGLGVAGFVNGGLALGWQQIPLRHFPDQTAIAYFCAVIELATGIGLLLKSTFATSCRILFAYLVLWVILLEMPVAVSAPLLGDKGDIGEIAIIMAGSWCLFAANAGSWATRHLPFVTGVNGIRAARLVLILALPMIGVEAIIDALHAGNGILPPWLAWLPSPEGWACLSGAGSIATCLGMVFGVLPRLATTMEAAMLGVITVVMWGPYLHDGRTPFTAFLISAAIATGVWLVADSYRDTPWLACGRASRGITVD